MKCEKCNKEMKLEGECDFEEYGLKGDGVVRYYVCQECFSECEFFIKDN